LSPAAAAWANGVLANVLDLDDGHSLTKGHPGAVVIPAAIAVAEHVQASANEALAAIAVGYEVAVRAAIAQHDRSPQYHGTGSWVPWVPPRQPPDCSGPMRRLVVTRSVSPSITPRSH